jgi:hypothetical protein
MIGSVPSGSARRQYMMSSARIHRTRCQRLLPVVDALDHLLNPEIR